MATLLDSLAGWLENGLRHIGQITLLSQIENPAALWSLCHADDAATARANPEKLVRHNGPSAARELVMYDDSGNYRPLRSAPDLRHGWLLEVDSLEALRESLDYFYPAALGLWRDYLAESLEIQALRTKLQRQTGMYRSANRLSDTRAQSLIRRVCSPESGCLKKILWEINSAVPIKSLPSGKFLHSTPEPNTLPLLCQEACNILVSEARTEARNEVIVVHG